MRILHAQPGGQHAAIRASEGDDGTIGSTRRGRLNAVNQYSKVGQRLLRTQIASMLQSLSCNRYKHIKIVLTVIRLMGYMTIG